MAGTATRLARIAPHLVSALVVLKPRHGIPNPVVFREPSR